MCSVYVCSGWGLESAISHSTPLLSSLTCSYLWGIIADTKGRRPVIIISTILMSICSLTFGFSTNFWMAVGCRCLMGFCNGMPSIHVVYVLYLCMPVLICTQDFYSTSTLYTLYTYCVHKCKLGEHPFKDNNREGIVCQGKVSSLQGQQCRPSFNFLRAITL